MNRAQAIINRVWPTQWPAFAPCFKQLAQAEQGRHWQHTLSVLAAMDALLNNTKHLAIPEAVTRRLKTQFGSVKIDPDILRATALLHDIGKGVSLDNHEEKSYRLFSRIIPNARPPGPREAMAAILIRHHAGLGSLQTGETSPLFLHRLINDIRGCNLNPDQILPALIFLTAADWAAYRMLSPAALEHFFATAHDLRQKHWWDAEETQIKVWLWQNAIDNTEKRLEHLLTFSYLASPPAGGSYAEAEKMAAQRAIGWPEFKRRFALVRFDGGYSVFARSLKLTGSAKGRLKFMIPHLIAWLPACPQTASFAAELPPALHRVNLRSIKGRVKQSNLTQLKKLLSAIDVEPENTSN